MTPRPAEKIYTLADYEADRARGAIVEGDDPATPREKADALTRVTAKMDRDEREHAMRCFDSGDAVTMWSERFGKRDVSDIEQWDALRAGVANLKGDA